MRKIIAAVGILGFVGCDTAAPTFYENFVAGKSFSMWHKAGSTGPQTDLDTTNCEVEALQRVPQQQVATTTPSFTTPTQTFCNRIGTQTLCNTTGGQTYGGGTTVRDVNAELRNRVFNQCMASKNYSYVTLPPCPEGIDVRIGMTSYLPLSRTSCYIAYPNGNGTITEYRPQS